MTSAPHPSVVVLAGPNGAGKSTAAPRLLRGALRVDEFVNADVIAKGLSAFDPNRVAFEAGKIMLSRLRALAAQRLSFAFETTLASRSFAPWLGALVGEGYRFHLLYLWLPTPDVAVARVIERVKRGGHDVPEGTIRRRYERGLYNFFGLYQPIASTWRLYENSHARSPRLIARGTGTVVKRVADEPSWARIRSGYDHG